jgi:hypothetical protein
LVRGFDFTDFVVRQFFFSINYGPQA